MESHLVVNSVLLDLLALFNVLGGSFGFLLRLSSFGSFVSSGVHLFLTFFILRFKILSFSNIPLTINLSNALRINYRPQIVTKSIPHKPLTADRSSNFVGLQSLDYGPSPTPTNPLFFD